MRSKKQTTEKQGTLTPIEKQLSIRMQESPKRYFSTLDICSILKCVSARDKVRKIKASGVPIGPAKFMHKTASGASVYAWRIAQ